MKLSIITINYNNAQGLEDTIKSIISQSSQDFEYLVIDGASTDSSVDIIKDYAENISYWVSEPDSGIYNAMNKGIKQAKGEYLLFVNSGDILLNDAKIDCVISHASGEDLIYYDIDIFDIDNNTHRLKTYPDFLDFKYFVSDSLPHPATLIKKELFDKHGFYSENIKIISDWAFFMDVVCLKACTYKHISESFSSFSSGGISSQTENQKLILAEKGRHISLNYKLYESIYKEWLSNREELYKLKVAASVRFLKKLGLLRWLKL
ncbi:glycosyltransferase family 2 protein [Dysgonomonas sp. ZJ279]|uniref:glycosyltransferase family 2 protein n=1 Tax=Dysgonomonas sp. ZJ279 TaxID=2709796 RepID=UPI0013EDE8ED|nr:glycosyltransferase family 2 protein [Dysgonomonas sp. ZJ279]